MAVLKVIKGNCLGQIIELHGEHNWLGRLPACQIVLEDPAVSRYHTQILESHRTYFIEDSLSRNGTRLNGTDIRGQGRTELRDGDKIGICEVEFQFLLKAPAPDPSVRGKLNGSSHNGGNPRNTVTFPVADTPPDDVPVLAPQNPPEIADDGRASSISSSFDVRARSYPQVHVRPEAKLRAILEISDNLGTTLQLDTVLPRILESLFKIFPQADRGTVVLQDPVTSQFEIKAFRLRRDGEEHESARISSTILSEAIEKSKAVLCNDAPNDPRFLSESVANLRIRSFMCVPLPCQSLGLRGAIQLDAFNLGVMFTSDDLDILAAVCSQAALALDNVHMHQAALKQRDLERELEFATQVQMGFLPSERPKIPGYSFWQYYEPAQRVGGDFFDYVPLPNGKTVVTVGDVAGKGVPAALLMARMYSDVRYNLLSYPTAAQAITHLNAGLSTGSLGHRFITFSMLVIDPVANTLTIVNAGHLPPLLRKKDKTIESLAMSISGLPLGIAPEIEYQQTVVEIGPGETILLYTDGVTEAMNHSNECYGPERLSEKFASLSGSVEDIVSKVIDDVELFCEGRSQRDDICLICFERQS